MNIVENKNWDQINLQLGIKKQQNSKDPERYTKASSNVDM